MTTKLTQAIRRLPDDGGSMEYALNRIDEQYIFIEIADLKKLVDDYEALLKAAIDFRASVDGKGGTAFADHARSRLDMAIDEGVEE